MGHATFFSHVLAVLVCQGTLCPVVSGVVAYTVQKHNEPWAMVALLQDVLHHGVLPEFAIFRMCSLLCFLWICGLWCERHCGASEQPQGGPEGKKKSTSPVDPFQTLCLESDIPGCANLSFFLGVSFRFFDFSLLSVIKTQCFCDEPLQVIRAQGLQRGSPKEWSLRHERLMEYDGDCGLTCRGSRCCAVFHKKSPTYLHAKQFLSVWNF